MKTGKKIAVGLAAALVVAIFAAGAVSMVGARFTEELPPFTVTVSAFNVNIVPKETDFGELLPGVTKEMNSFDLINLGTIDALVEGKFLTDEGGIFGLPGGSVIPAENFEINDDAFDNDGVAVDLDRAPAEVTTPYNAKLFVPIGQTDAVYTGIVELTFTPTLW